MSKSSPNSFFNNRRTGLNQSLPWGVYVCKGSRVLCSDGKIRSLAYLAQTADTYFSIPAAVRINGKRITGYVTTEEACPESRNYKVRRVATSFRQHSDEDCSLPEWESIGDEFSDEMYEFLAVACDEEENV